MAWTVTSRASASGTTQTATILTTASFTPTANSTLCMSVGFQANGDDWVGKTLSISDSLSGSWTLRTGPQRQGGTTGIIHYFWTQSIGASPSARTVTVDDSTGIQFAAGYSCFDVSDGSGVEPSLVQVNVTGADKTGGNAETHTHTLSSTPTNGNLVLGAFHSQNDAAGGYTLPTGFTSLVNLTTTFAHPLVCYRSDTTSTSIACTDLGQTIFCVAATGAEFAAGGAVAPVPNFSHRALQAVHRAGSW